MKVQTAPVGYRVSQMTIAPKGEAVPTIRFRNYRYPFGGNLSIDVEVNGVYPNRQYCICLSQPGEVYKGMVLKSPQAYINIPNASAEEALHIIAAIPHKNLRGIFRVGEPIKVGLCWQNAPKVEPITIS